MTDGLTNSQINWTDARMGCKVPAKVSAIAHREVRNDSDVGGLKMIVHVFRCLTDHYEIEVTIVTTYLCPACGRKMSYITSRKKEERK
jgi:predicted RNA-binding Zn-ribbon protein involved in translation (DUF1610 family)